MKKLEDDCLVRQKKYEQHALGNFLKYNTFYQDTHHFRKPELIRKHQFCAEHFEYDPEQDEFTCPAHQRLTFRYASRCEDDLLPRREPHEGPGRGPYPL